jgi:hypothetical protein
VAKKQQEKALQKAAKAVATAHVKGLVANTISGNCQTKVMIPHKKNITPGVY